MEKKELQHKLNSKELIVISNLFFNKDYPHCSITLEDVSYWLDCSKATSANILDLLTKKGVISKVKGFVNFYYPVADEDTRTIILERLGFRGKNE